MTGASSFARSGSTSDPSAHAVLIRGINVGGRNRVPMAALRESLTARGLRDVRTYIQSGNIVCGAPRGGGGTGDSDGDGGAGGDAVAAVVERALDQDFGVSTVVVVVSAESMAAILRESPTGFGSDPSTYHYDVAFLRRGITGSDASVAFGIREGVDAVWAGKGAVYVRRLSAQRARSRMSTVMASPLYPLMTIRNWRTTVAVAGMLTQD